MYDDNNNCAFRGAFYASQFFEIKVDLVIIIFGLYLFFLSYQSCASTEISTQFTGSSLTEVLSTERYIKTVRIPGYLCSVRFRVLQPERILKEAISRPLCLKFIFIPRKLSFAFSLVCLPVVSKNPLHFPVIVYSYS